MGGIDDYYSPTRADVGVICWILALYITFEALNTWAFVFSTKQARRGRLSFLVLFNLASNLFSLLVTWIFVMIPFNKHTGYMFIEGLGHIMMVNSYLWLLYNRLMALSARNRSRIWFWVVVCQPIVPAVDVLIFSLQFSNVIPDGTFKVTGTVFFLIVVAIEMVYNLATLRELMRIYQGQSAASLESGVHSFLVKCMVTMTAQFLIDVALVITNFLIDPLIFIMLKRLVYTFKSRVTVFMFDQAKTDLLVRRPSSLRIRSENSKHGPVETIPSSPSSPSCPAMGPSASKPSGKSKYPLGRTLEPRSMDIVKIDSEDRTIVDIVPS